MKLTSSAFASDGEIPARFTCDGDNIHPELKISDVPRGTFSLVFIVEDPDSPGKTWTHWTVWNVDPDIEGVAEGGVPKRGVEGLTDFGQSGYGGPCPASGLHRYFFRLYALDTEINLPKGSSRKALENAMLGHVLDETELMGLYARR